MDPIPASELCKTNATPAVLPTLGQGRLLQRRPIYCESPVLCDVNDLGASRKTAKYLEFIISRKRTNKNNLEAGERSRSRERSQVWVKREEEFKRGEVKGSERKGREWERRDKVR